MACSEALLQLRDAFRDVARPTGLFVRETCSCCECAEHNLTLSSHDIDSISLKELGNPGWDPMCFASDEAFLYYLPAMFRLAFEDKYYIDQLLFHLNQPDRIAKVNNRQACAMLAALSTWAQMRAGDVDEECFRSQLDEARRRLETIAQNV